MQCSAGVWLHGQVVIETLIAARDLGEATTAPFIGMRSWPSASLA